jgi:hypothetical protein
LSWFAVPSPPSAEDDTNVGLPVIIRGMDTNQTKVIELLREVRVLAFKEIRRLNLRIAELEIRAAR